MSNLESRVFEIHERVCTITSFNVFCDCDSVTKNYWRQACIFLNNKIPSLGLVSGIHSHLGISDKESILTGLVSWVGGLNDVCVLLINCQH